MRKLRQSLALLACAALGLSVLAAAPARAADTLTHVTIAQTSNSLGWAGNYIADSEGFFRQQKLDVDIQIVGGGDPQVFAAMRSGGAQFGAVTTIAALEALSKGEPLKMISPYVDQFVVQIVMNPDFAKKHGITDKMPLKEKFARLKGAIVGTLDVGGGLDLLFRGLAKEYGLSVDQDFTETAIHSYAALLAACKRGEVNVALTAIPYGTVGTQEYGLVSIADFWSGGVPEFDGAVHEGLFVTKEYAAGQPDVVDRMQRALGQAYAFIHQHPDRAVEDLHKRFPALPVRAIQTLIVTDAASYPSNVTVSKRGFEIVRDFVASYIVPSAKSIGYRDVVLPSAQQK